MAGKVLSIEIGYSYTKVCELDYLVKKPKVYQRFQIPTPQGIMSDGMLTVDEAFVASIKTQLTERKIRTKNVIFTIASSKIASREVRIPYCKENRISDLVRANLTDYFPIDLSQYKIAHTILSVEQPEQEGEKAKKPQPTGYRLLLLAVPAQILKNYELFAAALGLELKDIDYNGNSIHQAAKEACPEGTQMLVKIDERSSMILVEKDGVIVLNRTISYGMDDMIAELMNTVSFENVNSYENALAFAGKNTCILEQFPASLYAADKQAEDDKEETETGSASKIEQNDKANVTESLIPLVGAISKVADYYNSNNTSAPIQKLYLTGVGSNVAGIDRLLANELGIKTGCLNTITNCNVEKAFKGEAFGEYTSCIGAVLSPVHFYSEKEEETLKGSKKGGTDTMRIALLLCVGCIVIGVAMILSSLLPYLGEKKKFDEYNAIINELQPVYEVYLNYQSLDTQVTQMKGLDAATINRNEELGEFITALETKMPSSFRLNDMSATAEGIVMNVTVGSKEEAAAVLEELRMLPSFIFVDTTSLSELITEIGEVQYSFAVQLTYAPIEKEPEAGMEQTDGIASAEIQ